VLAGGVSEIVLVMGMDASSNLCGLRG
jgi:hypothetical protein